MAFSKLKTLIRKAAAGEYQALWKQVGRVCDLFTSQECSNYFRAAGYGGNGRRHALARIDRAVDPFQPWLGRAAAAQAA